MNRELWRWYILLFIANELDLVYTYFGLSRGVFQEANPLLRPHLFTLWPIMLKVVGLAGLALGIVAALQAGVKYQQRLLRVLRATTTVYVAILVMHLVYLLETITRG